MPPRVSVSPGIWLVIQFPSCSSPASPFATSWQGKGLGAGLLKDEMLRTLQAADIAGIRAFVVHAKDDQAKAFYEHFGFSALPSDPYHLFRLLKDIRADRKS